jgi:hypothetical protein
MSNMKKNDQKWELPSKKPWSLNSIMVSLNQLLYDKHYRIHKNHLDPKVQKAIVWLVSQGLTAEPRRAREPLNADTKQMYNLIANIVTSLWRVRRKLAQGSEDGANKIISKHIESAFDTLATAKVKVKDHTGEKYVSGMSLKVVAFQPNPELKFEKITETIKPTIIYKDLLLQRGEVIVETPGNEATSQSQNNK